MARKIRIEFPGAIYHLINRGNYRSFIFETEGAKRAFMLCLHEVVSARGWRLHAWVLMGNHYHLCIETPLGDLVDGMRWLQSTFANRFNRYRKENGHVFQGRYKAILVDPGVVGRVCDYIHLNPVRASLADVADLESYAWSSFHWLWHKRRRWQEFDASTCMEAAGSLPDTPRGRSLYRDHLDLLAEDDDAQRKQKFDQISRGWMFGSSDYRKAVLKGLKLPPDQRLEEGEAADLRIQRYERLFELGLAALGKTSADIFGSKKSASWKIALASYLREHAQAPLPWLSEKLCTGPPNSLSSLISRHRREGKDSLDIHEKIKNS